MGREEKKREKIAQIVCQCPPSNHRQHHWPNSFVFMAMSLRIHRSPVFEKHFSFSGPGNAVYHATSNKLFRFRPFGIIV